MQKPILIVMSVLSGVILSISAQADTGVGPGWDGCCEISTFPAHCRQAPYDPEKIHRICSEDIDIKGNSYPTKIQCTHYSDNWLDRNCHDAQITPGLCPDNTKLGKPCLYQESVWKTGACPSDGTCSN